MHSFPIKTLQCREKGGLKQGLTQYSSEEGMRLHYVHSLECAGAIHRLLKGKSPLSNG